MAELRFLNISYIAFRRCALVASFCVFFVFGAKCTHAEQRTTSILSRKSSGTLESSTSDNSNESRSSDNHRKKSVVLTPPVQSGDVPTLAADLNTALMGPDMVKAMDEQYAERLRTFSMNNGFYASSQFSRRGSATGQGIQKEAEIRRDMAQSIQKYMIIRGIPKFLAAKPDTKKLVQTYNQVVVMSKIEGKTESRWEYKTGINPFQLRAFGNVQKDGWFFETSTLYKKDARHRLKEIYVVSNKSFLWSTFSSGCNYEVWAEALTPNVSKVFNKKLSANLGTRLPLGATYVLPNAVTTLALNYSF